jgi:hypothetical protein
LVEDVEAVEGKEQLLVGEQFRNELTLKAAVQRYKIVAAAGRGDGVAGVFVFTRVHEEISVGELELYGERRKTKRKIFAARK